LVNEHADQFFGKEWSALGVVDDDLSHSSRKIGLQKFRQQSGRLCFRQRLEPYGGCITPSTPSCPIVE
jgi:hypothetical protein